MRPCSVLKTPPNLDDPRLSLESPSKLSLINPGGGETRKRRWDGRDFCDEVSARTEIYLTTKLYGRVVPFYCIFDLLMYIDLV